ncbi:MAG: 3-oxoacyl-[acyl-carrier-protein] reductase [Spirochaetales bacterium]|nr:3-oxoacyl-[acyl-carrier-protein] reductase [Spirochaetales bacterium]
MLLKGKKALVTGGSRGIGKAIVTRFLNEGAEVYFISTKESPYIAEMEEAAKASGTAVHWYGADVSNEEEITGVVNTILEEAGDLDILVNNAGITRDGLSFRMKSEDWEKVMRVNLFSAFYISKPISMKMAKARKGSIINVSSVVGVMGNAGQVNYAASKAGLIGYTKSLAKETAARGVRVNAIAPGYIETEMTEAMNDKAKDGLKAMIPMGRGGSAEEVANTIVFLASDLSTYITGQVLGIDGGMGM